MLLCITCYLSNFLKEKMLIRPQHKQGGTHRTHQNGVVAENKNTRIWLITVSIAKHGDQRVCIFHESVNVELRRHSDLSFCLCYAATQDGLSPAPIFFLFLFIIFPTKEKMRENGNFWATTSASPSTVFTFGLFLRLTDGPLQFGMNKALLDAYGPRRKECLEVY